MTSDLKKTNINKFKIKLRQLTRHISSNLIIYGLLILIALIMVVPMLTLLNVSLKTPQEFLRNPVSITRKNLLSQETYANYLVAFKKLQVIKRFTTTLIMTFLSAVLTCVLATLAAFPISRNHFKGSKRLYSFFLASIFFPGSLVATVFLIRMLGLYDNPIGVMLLWSIGGLSTNIFIMVGFVKTIPRELDDAAIIDGSTYFRYIFTVAFPLMKPIIATVFMLKMIGAWNDFVTPYLFLIKPEFRTLSTGLFLFRGQYANNWPVLSAAILIVIFPMVLLYIFVQRYIIEGITAGALKG